MTDERRGLGNIAERLIAAVIPDPSSDVAARKKEVEGTYGWDWVPRPEEGLAAKINARELEERVKKELRGVMLLGERDEVSCSQPVTSIEPVEHFHLPRNLRWLSTSPSLYLTSSLTRPNGTTTKSPLPFVNASASWKLKYQ